MKTTTLFRSVGPALLLAVSPGLYAQSSPNVDTVNCNGTLNGGQAADVIVGSGGCTLSGVEVFGSVKAENGGNIRLTNGTTVQGSVEVKDGGNVIVNGGSSVGELKIEKSGDIRISGAGTTVAALFAFESGRIRLEKGASVFPGGVTAIKNAGNLNICGANIGFPDGGGGITLIELSGNVAVKASCDGASNIEGTIIAEKGTGKIEFLGANLFASDLIVIEQFGNVTLDNGGAGASRIEFSDINISGGMGNVTITNARTDSDTSITEQAGNVSITKTVLGSDVSISGVGKVNLDGNDFSLEDVILEKINGRVDISNNVNLGVNLIEIAKRIRLTGNTITDADISKNTGGVILNGNTFEALKCSDNSPAPTGSGNTVTELADGQCSGF